MSVSIGDGRDEACPTGRGQQNGLGKSFGLTFGGFPTP